MFTLEHMNEDELRELRLATTSTASTKLEMLAGVIMTAVRHLIDREIARRRDIADAAAKQPREAQGGTLRK